MKRNQIFKAQVSIVSTAPDGQHILIYDKGRRFVYQGPFTDELQRKLPGLRDELKAFYYGRLIDGQISLDGAAPWQEW